MELQIALLVIGLLEQDIGADTGVLELSVILNGGRGDIDVDAADRAVLVLDRIDGVDTLEDVLDRVHHRILAALDGKALVTHILQRDDLRLDLLLRQLFARNGLVLHVIRTVQTAVDAVVREVQRREDDDTVAVEGELDLLRDLIDPTGHLGILAREQYRRLTMGQAVTAAAGRGRDRMRLFKDLVDQGHVVLILLRISEGLANLFIIDELLRVQ